MNGIEDTVAIVRIMEGTKVQKSKRKRVLPFQRMARLRPLTN